MVAVSDSGQLAISARPYRFEGEARQVVAAFRALLDAWNAQRFDESLIREMSAFAKVKRGGWFAPPEKVPGWYDPTWDPDGYVGVGLAGEPQRGPLSWGFSVGGGVVALGYFLFGGAGALLGVLLALGIVAFFVVEHDRKQAADQALDPFPEPQFVYEDGPMRDVAVVGHLDPRRMLLALRLAREVGARLGETTPLCVEMDLSPPADSPTTQKLPWKVLGLGVDHDSTSSLVEQPWLRVTWQAAGEQGELRASDLFRHRRWMWRLRSDEDFDGRYKSYYWEELSEPLAERWELRGSRLWWTGRSPRWADPEVAALEALDRLRESRPQGVPLRSVDSCVAQGAVALQAVLDPEQVLQPDHVGLLLEWTSAALGAGAGQAETPASQAPTRDADEAALAVMFADM